MNIERQVTVVDRPCGSGKTTMMINTFDPRKRYLVCTPLLSECERIVRDAKIAFNQPEVIKDDPDIETKKDHLVQLLDAGKNVVTTHAMFDQLADVAREGLLDGYEIVIDEVMSVADDNYRVKKRTWEKLYVGVGYVSVDPMTGLITPTSLWDDDVDQVDDAIKARIYGAAHAGRLYHIRDGINLAVMPEVLLKAGNSLTVYTFKAEGSLMMAYLKRLGLNPKHDTGGPSVEQAFVRKARQLITVKRIPSLEGYPFSYTGQTDRESTALNKLVPRSLMSLHRNGLSDVPLDTTIVICPKEKWYHNGREPVLDNDGKERTPFNPGPYASRSGMAVRGYNRDRAVWLPNTTRGTNDYKHCTHMIYLYDQFLNPNIQNWFGGPRVITHEEYALTELIQVLWRTQVRDDKPVTVYIPSERMRNLLLEWLWEGVVPQEVKDQLNRAYQ